MIGEMRSRITVKAPTFSKDAAGGVSVSYSSGYSLWAKVDNRSGQAQYQEGQRLTNYNYRIKVRYFASAIITTANIIVYNGLYLRVDSVEFEREGNLDYVYLNCSESGVS